MVHLAQLPHSNLAPLFWTPATPDHPNVPFFNKSKVDYGVFINMYVLLAHSGHILGDFSLIPGQIVSKVVVCED